MSASSSEHDGCGAARGRTTADAWKAKLSQLDMKWPEGEFGERLVDAMNQENYDQKLGAMHKYRALCAGDSTAKAAGGMRHAMFMMLSARLGFFSPEQEEFALPACDQFFCKPECGAGFFMQHFVEAHSMIEALERAKEICVEKAKREQFKKNCGLDEISFRPELPEEVSKEDMAEATSQLIAYVPDWVVVFICFSTTDLHKLGVLHYTKLHMAMHMDLMVDHCSLLDLDMGLRGADVMDVYMSEQDPKQKDVRVYALGVQNAMMDVRTSVASHYRRISGQNQNVNSSELMKDSFTRLVKYLMVRSPDIDNRRLEDVDFGERSELILARRLRRVKKEYRQSRKREIKNKIKNGEIKEAHEVAATIAEAFYHALAKISAGEEGVKLEAISLPGKMTWLYCTVARCESVVDWWWATEGASAYSKYRLLSDGINKCENEKMQRTK